MAGRGRRARRRGANDCGGHGLCHNGVYPLRARAVRSACPAPRPAPPAPRRPPGPPRPRPAPPRAACGSGCVHVARMTLVPPHAPQARRRLRPAICPNACSGHGRCASDGTCECHAGWMRFDCSERCPSACSGGYTPLAGGPTNRSALGARGLCVDGSCVCLQGWTEADCSKPTCPAQRVSLRWPRRVRRRARGVPLRGGWAGPDCLNARARTGRAVTAASASTSAATAPLASRVRIAALNYASTAALKWCLQVGTVCLSFWLGRWAARRPAGRLGRPRLPRPTARAPTTAPPTLCRRRLL